MVLMVVMEIGQGRCGGRRMGGRRRRHLRAEVIQAEVVLVVVMGWRGGRNHIWSLVALHVRGEGRGGVVAPIADGALEGLPVVVGLEVNLEVVGS